MTEIPEHLLKRSRERRSAIGKGDDAGADAGAAADAGEATTSSTSPATTSSSAPATTASVPAATGPAARTPAPAPAPTPPATPEPVYVTAAKQRKKIPFWAMATLSLMPIWAFMYVRAVTKPPATVEGPIGMGAEIYSNCAGCHGAAGGGGVGYGFSGGSVEATFPKIEDQIRWVYYGTEGYNAAGIDIYGNPDRPGGPHVTGAKGVMPQFGSQLSQYEIIAVVCHERYTLGGVDPTSAQWADEYNKWCATDAPVFAAVEAGEYDITSTDPGAGGVEISPIGPAPVAGSAG